MNRLIRILILTLFIVAAPLSTFADNQLTLQWYPGTGTDIAGYRLYLRAEGTSYDYETFAWQSADVETQCTIDDLDEDTVYFAVIRAFDQDYNESDDSNEICWPSDAPACSYNDSYIPTPTPDSANLGGSGKSYSATGGSGCFIASMINP